MSNIYILNEIDFDNSLLPAIGFKNDNFVYRFRIPKKGDVTAECFGIAGNNERGKITVPIPYTPINTSGGAMVGNFKGKFVSDKFPKSNPKQIEVYFSHLDWMIKIGVPGVKRFKELLQTDAFINALMEFEPDPKKPGETKFLVYYGYDPEPITSNSLVKEHWLEYRLSQLKTSSGTCFLSGKESNRLVNIWPYGIERPQRLSTDCKISSFDKSYTWSQSAVKKELAVCPVDFLESDRLLAKLQWFFDYTSKDEPSRRIQIDADTHIILFTGNLCLFDASQLASVFVDSNDDSDNSDDDTENDVEDDIDAEEEARYIERKRQSSLSYWVSPVNGEEINPDKSTLVYGLTCKFKRGRFCITDAWQGLTDDVENNYQKFIDSQKATGMCLYYGQKRDILPIKALASVIEPHGVKTQVARIIEVMYRAALYGDKLPVVWLLKTINRFAIDAKLSKDKRDSHQEWKLKLINLIMENHNMNNTESDAFKLGKALAYLQIGQVKAMNVQESNTMVIQNLSVILRSPAAIMPQIIERFLRIYNPKLKTTYFKTKIFEYGGYSPLSLTIWEKSQVISGLMAGTNEIFTKRPKTESVADIDTDNDNENESDIDIDTEIKTESESDIEQLTINFKGV